MTNQIANISNLELDIRKDIEINIDRTKIKFPQNYSVENALQSAFLSLRDVVDKSGRPALDVCNRDSIQRALFSMIIQGLNPAKDQCYFIVYGSRLSLMRSYLGSIAVARRVELWLKDIRAVAVYEEDTFEYRVIDGIKEITAHHQTLKSTMGGRIAGAYALAIDHDNKVAATEVMDIKQIHTAWRRSRQKVFLDDNKINPASNHAQFPDMMARRTVINRLCKKIISTSSDELLLTEALKTDAEITFKDEIKYNANQRRIDFDQPEGEPPADDGKPVAIDFNDPAPATETAAPVEMATKDDCRKIYDLNVQAGRKDKADVLGQVGGFIGHEIHGLSDLTKSEAASYIAAIEDELKSEPKPDWL